MKVMLARNYGMCFGVRRALDIALDAGKKNNGKRIYTYGPLVHNKDVVDLLESRGIHSVDSIDDISDPDGAVLIIRAHGVPDSDYTRAEEKGMEVIDATCPFVAKAKTKAKELEREGLNVVILGQKDHPEVRGIAESLRSPVIIVSPDDINRLDGDDYGLVSQTTQSGSTFDSIVEGFMSQGKRVKAINTICSATIKRQESAKETAGNADVMLVIGGMNSANTGRLADICSGMTETKHIERAEDLKNEWFEGRDTVGITAGASTPDWIVEGVINKLKEI
ncbi:MAG: 4-hydroxy-3-methylbut-2-enyl diphosphate reductase [Candidatus Woesearchaeota archaeon]